VRRQDAIGADWHALLSPIRKAAVALAQAGRLVIYRHGKPVDDRFSRRVQTRIAAAGLARIQCLLCAKSGRLQEVRF
jgi:hypothetical protein